MDGNTIRRDQRTLYKLKQISRLIIINPWPALIIECRPNVHFLLLLLLFFLLLPLFSSSSSPHSRERSHREIVSRGPATRERERERKIFARCVRDNASLPSECWALNYERRVMNPSLFPPPISFVTKAGGGGHIALGSGGRSRLH